MIFLVKSGSSLFVLFSVFVSDKSIIYKSVFALETSHFALCVPVARCPFCFTSNFHFTVITFRITIVSDYLLMFYCCWSETISAKKKCDMGGISVL